MRNVRMKSVRLTYRIAVLSLVIGCWLLGSFSAAFAAATIAAVPSGNGVYAVVGSGLSGVAGLDLTLTYDTSTLGNPRVEKGGMLGNAIFVANPNQSGIVRIGVLSTGGISGSGAIASITFDRKGDSAGLLTGLTATMINANSAPLPVTTSYSNAVASDSAQTVKTDTPSSGGSTSPPPAGGSGTVLQGSTGTTTTTSGGSVYLGTVTMPGDTAAGQTEKRAETPKYDQQPVQGQDTTASSQAGESGKSTPEEKKAPVEKKSIVFPSVAERIKAFQDRPTMEKLVAAFVLAKDLPYLQSPRIVLTDGKTSVSVTVSLGDDGKETPTFALDHGKLLSLKQNEEGEWLVEVLPSQNANDAALTVSLGESVARIPLTVAQPLTAKQLGDLKPISEKSFGQFLKERGTKDLPRYDLNGDGKRDYLDDYIFAANYLAQREASSPGEKKAPAPVPPKKP